MFDASHELFFLEFVFDVNASSKSKSVKKAKKKEEWKPIGKVLTKIRYNWRPTRRTLTLVGNACPLTRITTTNKVTLREPIPLEVVSQESIVTKVYNRRPKVPKTNGSNSKPKIEKSMISNKTVAGTSRGSNTSVSPSSSSLVDLRRHGKTPYELLHDRKPNLSYLHIFGALCYHNNDSENLGKFQAKADIGPELQCMILAASSSGLVSNPILQQPCNPPPRDDWDHLFQPMFDKYFNPPAIVVFLVSVANAPRAVELADSPVYTSIDQDAPSTSAVDLTLFTRNAGNDLLLDTRRSTSGSAQVLGDELVSWSSKKQKSTMISSEKYLGNYTSHKPRRTIRFLGMNKKKKFYLNLETFRDIFQICPRVHGQDFDKLPYDEVIMYFFKELGHSREIKSITNVVVDQMHQSWRTFATIINRILSGKTTGLDKLRLSRAQILWGMYYKKNVDYVELLWEDFTYHIRNKGHKKQEKIPEMRETKAYKTYLGYATVVTHPKKARKFKKTASPKLTTIPASPQEPKNKSKIVKRPTKKSNNVLIAGVVIRDTPIMSISKKKAPAKADRDKGIKLLSDATLLEDAQLKKALKKSKQETHKLQASGSKYDDLYIDVNIRSKVAKHEEVRKGDVEMTDATRESGSQEKSYEQVVEDADSYTAEFKKEAQAEKKRYIDLIEKSVKDIINNEVKTQLPQILPKAMSDLASLVIQSAIAEPFKHVVLAKSSSQPQSTYEAAMSLTKFKLKKILLDKMQESQSYCGAKEHKELYDGLSKPILKPTTKPSTTLIPALPNFSSLFGFDHRVSTLEKELSQLKQVDHSAQILTSIRSQIPAMVDDHLSTRIEFATQTALQSYTTEFKKKAQEEKDRYINLVEKSIKDIIKDEVKIQLPQILTKEVSYFATHVIQSSINESLENVILAKSSSQPKSTYEATASLIEFELKKILLDKIQKNKDEDPSVRSDLGLKKRKTSNNVEPTKGPNIKESTSSSSKGTRSQSKSSGKYILAEEPEFEVADSDMPHNQERNLGNDDEEPMREVASKRNWFTKPKQPQEPTDPDWNVGKTPQQGPTQSWLMALAATDDKPSKTFDEFMSTPIDFSAYIMNGLNITNLTQETLLGPAFKLLKGIHTNFTELEYDIKECYKALSEKLDWDNPEGGDYPFDLTKSLPLLMNGNRQINRLTNLSGDDAFDLAIAL
nr:integrase, catalytic region, zinc finger, CCHC-type, peptidase aspartic, catalytic [Tanacetum cinerariifolium]